MTRDYREPTVVRVDLTGRVFKRLKVVSLLGSCNQKLYWLCECECGTYVHTETGKLTSGNTKSCGCLRRDTASQRNTATITKHGMSKTREYVAWGNMMHRCYRKNNTHYYRYGERGITVEDYLKEFKNFYEYMGACPEGMTLDRVDNSKGYVRGNLRWASQRVQQNNKDNNVLIVGCEQRTTATQFAEKHSLDQSTVTYRANNGYSSDEILKVPKFSKRIVYWKGGPTSLLKVSEESGIPYQRLWARINRQGLSVDEAVERG